MIGITSDADVAKEFVDINQYASRATWSNCNSAAQNVMIDICSDSAKVARLDAERNKYFKLIGERAAIFMEEAKDAGVKFVPYISGFFITIPLEGAQKVCDCLEKDNVFLVPMKKGIRLAVCSVSKEKDERPCGETGGSHRNSGRKAVSFEAIQKYIWKTILRQICLRESFSSLQEDSPWKAYSRQ